MADSPGEKIPFVEATPSLFCDFLERRRTKRGKCRHSARIVTKPNVILDCQITNISKQGARLILEVTEELPESFFLILDELIFAVRLVWREKKRAGVELVLQSNIKPHPNTQSGYPGLAT